MYDPKILANKIKEYLEKKGVGHYRWIDLHETDSGYDVTGSYLRPAGYTEDGDVIHVDVSFAVSVDQDGLISYDVKPISLDYDVENEDFAERLMDIATAEVEEWIKEAIEYARGEVGGY